MLNLDGLVLFHSLNIKLIGYESNKSFFVRECDNVFQSTGEFASSNMVKNDLVVHAIRSLGYDVGYMNQADRISHYEFIRHLLNDVAFQQGLTGKNDWLFETL